MTHAHDMNRPLVEENRPGRQPKRDHVKGPGADVRTRPFRVVDAAHDDGFAHMEPSVGDTLKAAREARGEDLAEISALLRIRYVYMEAIEQSRFRDLPGSTYAYGFVRTYGEYLGFDGEILARQLKDEISGNLSQQQLYFPTPAPEAHLPGGTILLVSVLLVALVYGGWYYVSTTERTFVDMVPSLPARLASLLDFELEATTENPVPDIEAPMLSDRPETSPELDLAALEEPPAVRGGTITTTPSEGYTEVVMGQDAPPLEEGSAAPPDAERSGTESDTLDDAILNEDGVWVARPGYQGAGRARQRSIAAISSAEAAPAASDPTQEQASGGSTDSTVPPPGTPASEETGTTEDGQSAARIVAEAERLFGEENGRSRILLQATDTSWIRVRSASGGTLFERLLQPGDVYRVPDQPGITLRVGNAGGLSVLVDGQSVPALGDRGEVLRNVALEPESLRNRVVN